MSDEPIDLEKYRNKRLPVGSFLEMPEDHEIELVQLFLDGEPVPGKTGLDLQLEGVPALSLTAAQCRNLGEALLRVAEHLEPR